MTGTCECFIDTNILVYAYDTTEKEKHKKSRLLLSKCWQRKIRLAISTQVLSEFFVVVTRKIQNRLTVDDAQQIIMDLVKHDCWQILEIKPATILNAIKASKVHKTSYWDTLIAETMKENQVFKIYTENKKDFARVPQLEIINLFE